MNVFEQMASLIGNIYSGLGVVVNAAGILCLGICALKWIMASDANGARQAKTWGFGILGGLVLYNLAGVIVNTINSLG